MTHHERATLADRCARCDASTGAQDAQATLAEARAQIEQSRRERDEARQSSEYLHVRWTETAARADGLEEQLAEARRERDEARERARVSDRCRLANEAELRRADARIGHLHAALKEAGEGAAQALLAEKALAAEKAALVARVGELESARVERDRLRAHYDAAGPEHNLLALLDHYVEESSERVLESQGLRARVAELEAALRGLVDAAQVMAESHAEFHDNVIILETVDDPMDAAILAARAALEVKP